METHHRGAHDDVAHDDTTHDDYGGLRRDIRRPIDRRRALQLLGGAGLIGVLAACDSSGSVSSPGSTATPAASDASAISTTSDTSTSTSMAPSTGTANTGESGDVSSTLAAGQEIPDETGGPYPADGTNGPNVLVETGIERNDITTSFGDLSGTAAGVPTRFDLQVIDADTGVPISGAAVYLWHCTAEGRYSIYEVTDQNYLRGIQATDADGVATFTSVYPGCYNGRWPHAHFEVYESIEAASTGSATRQDVATRPPRGCVFDGVHGRPVRRQRPQSEPNLARIRQRVRRRVGRSAPYGLGLERRRLRSDAARQGLSPSGRP